MRQQFHYQPATGIEALIRDFQSETGITLVWRRDSEHHPEPSCGWPWREEFAVIDSFFFKVPGATVSANMPERTTYGCVDAATDEIYEADEMALLDAIKKVCGFDPSLHVIIE